MNPAGRIIPASGRKSNPSVLKQALVYLREGLSIIPIRPGTKAPRISWEEFQKRWPTEEEIHRWFSEDGVGVGVVCGEISNGLVVLDFDGLDYAEVAVEFEENFQEIAYGTRRVATGSGKLHLWLRCSDLPDDLTRIAWKFPDLGDAAVELRGNGHYIVAPPSVHPSGKPYRFLNSKPILEIPWDKLQEIIAWFDVRGKRAVGQNPRQIQTQNTPHDVVCRKGDVIREAAEYYLQRALAVASPGNRNCTGFWLACQLRDLGLDESEAEGYMIQYANGVPPGDHPYTAEEALASLRSAYKREPREPAIPGLKKERKYTPSGMPVEEVQLDPKLMDILVQRNLTDAGNAECFRDIFGAHFRWVKEKGAWFRWDGVRWVEDDEAALRAMLEVARLRARAAVSIEDEERRAKVLKWALASENNARLNAALNIAAAFLTVRYTDFDKDPWLLCCANGVIDLRTGELRPSKPEDMLHRSTNIRYDPTAECPRWERFLREIFLEDEGLIGFVRRAVGYSLTGLMPETVFVCYGTGANGKSTFLTVLAGLLGENAAVAPPSVFRRGMERGEAPSPDLAKLAGARLAKAVEVRENIRLDEERVKALTGGDRLTARFLHRDYFDFYPTAKLWWCVNHRPVIRDTTFAMWRRVCLIPFEARFEPNKGNWQPKEELLAELKAELPGILAWAVRGCLEWQKGGLEPAEKVRAATEEYRQESDVIERFLEERCIQKPEAKVKASELYQEYRRWCEENGETPMTNTAFGRRMREKGIEKAKEGRYIFYRGIGLLAEDEGSAERV